MATLLQTRTAIDFLIAEKKAITISVSDHIANRDLFAYDTTRSGTRTIKTHEDLDWDEFYFEIDIDLDFDFASVHQRETREQPNDETIGFDNLKPSIEIEICMRWNPEDKELQDYRMTDEERKKVLKYLGENINLEP